jgi:hypothetical protein
MDYQIHQEVSLSLIKQYGKLTYTTTKKRERERDEMELVQFAFDGYKIIMDGWNKIMDGSAKDTTY